MLSLTPLLLAFLGTANGLVLPAATPRAAAAVVSRSLCVTMEDTPKAGTCKWFDVEKGYGFITLEGEERDVFVHQSDIYSPGFRSLAEGEALEFRLITDDKTGKTKAVDVTGPDGAYVQGAPRREFYEDEEY